MAGWVWGEVEGKMVGALLTIELNVFSGFDRVDTASEQIGGVGVVEFGEFEIGVVEDKKILVR